MKRFVIGMAVAISLLGGASPVRAQEKIELKENMKQGDTFTVTTFMEQSMEIHVKAGPQEMTQKVMNRREEVLGTQVQAVDKGRPTKVRRHYVTQKETNENSQAPGAKSKDGHDAGRIYVITGLGQDRKVECLNDKIDPEKGKTGIKNNPQGMLLPGRAVAVGEAWDVPADVLKQLFFDDKGKSPEQVSMKCKLVAVDDEKGVKSARISVDLALVQKQGEGPEMTMTLVGEGRFGIANGTFMGWELKGKTVIKGDQKGPNGEEISMTGEGPITIRELWAAGKADLGDEKKKLEVKGGDDDGDDGE